MTISPESRDGQGRSPRTEAGEKAPIHVGTSFKLRLYLDVSRNHVMIRLQRSLHCRRPDVRRDGTLTARANLWA